MRRGIGRTFVLWVLDKVLGGWEILRVFTARRWEDARAVAKKVAGSGRYRLQVGGVR